jgi:hypothetical protein
MNKVVFSTNKQIKLSIFIVFYWAFFHCAIAADIPSASDICMGGVAETTPSTDFTAMDDGSRVLHKPTTLEWQRCALGQTWNAAASICDGKPKIFSWAQVTRLTTTLIDNWRLPSDAELLSIVEKCHLAPAINSQVFPNTQGTLFWSISFDKGSVERIWSISFFTGKPHRPGKIQTAKIRLVRGTFKPPVP